MSERRLEVMYQGLPFYTTVRTKRIFNGGTSLELYNVGVLGCRVVDIGGLNGETAVFFHKWGATHVTVVEGAPENIPLIMANMERHEVPGRVVQAFVGAAAGTMTIHYNAVDGGYGLRDALQMKAPTRFEREVQVVPMAQVLENALGASSGPFVVKCDCEGGEIGFSTCPRDLLKRVRTYVMETHSKHLARTMLNTFTPLGFKATFLEGGMRNRPMYRFDQ